MWSRNLLLILGCLHTCVLAQWSCTQDSDCSDLQNSVCHSGVCGCPTGQQVALAGTACVDLAPYHTSQCVEDFQCSRLFTMFECKKNNETEDGSCQCQPGYHYFHGRCWRSVEFGNSCTHDEECFGVLRDPYNMQCTGAVCACAEGYYERQRGECRKIAYGVGDGCVVDEDCQFTNGVCEIPSLQCVDSTASTITKTIQTSPVNKTLPVNKTSPVNLKSAVSMTAVSVKATHGVRCDTLSLCAEPLVCSTFGACVCPVGYYLSDTGEYCNAELGSPSSPAQCVGLLAEVIDGVCACPPNFFYEENMRDCIKVTRLITESCVSDENCHTFGAASRCGAPSEPWGLRTCECDTEQAVWDTNRYMCRLFAGIGEYCEADAECLAGALEVQCLANTCTCPAHTELHEGLCLTTGLDLGDSCQSSLECTETANSACVAGECACAPSYQDIGGFCAPIIGGSCVLDSECVIENTVCVNETATCQCRDGFVPYDDICWPVSAGYESSCNVTAQCTAALGEAGACSAAACVCGAHHHHRDGRCHPVTELFEACSRTSECYLQSISDRVVCRNGLCQCDFDHPYSEELHTCLPSSSPVTIAARVTIIATVLISLVLS